MSNQQLSVMMGGVNTESPTPVYVASPTCIVDEAWEAVEQVAFSALDAYMHYCRENNLPHSYYLGLDILITAAVDPQDPTRLADIRPVILEGPCCNSYPASMDFYPYSLYCLARDHGVDVDIVDYPTHPTRLDDKIVEIFLDIWAAQGEKRSPRVGIFTRSYPESEEERAHHRTLDAFARHYVEAHRITPDERPSVKNGKLWVHGVPIDMCFRRIERIHVPLFYGEKLGRQIVEETGDTIWLNNFKVDDLRSKTIEERAFRSWEKASGGRVSRPITLLGDEITPDAVAKLCQSGGFVRKVWNSTGGKGVFIHGARGTVGKIFDKLYLRYDGRHMKIFDDEEMPKELQVFQNYKEDASIQQMRTIDARVIGDQERLVYDTRLNVFYNEKLNKWEIFSGISRVVPCGPEVANGNSILTNVSSGAFMAPLLMGHSRSPEIRKKLNFGPLLQAMMDKQDSIQIG